MGKIEEDRKEEDINYKDPTVKRAGVDVIDWAKELQSAQEFFFGFPEDIGSANVLAHKNSQVSGLRSELDLPKAAFPKQACVGVEVRQRRQYHSFGHVEAQPGEFGKLGDHLKGLDDASKARGRKGQIVRERKLVELLQMESCLVQEVEENVIANNEGQPEGGQWAPLLDTPMNANQDASLRPQDRYYAHLCEKSLDHLAEPRRHAHDL